jgi:hypothetical protein
MSTLRVEPIRVGCNLKANIRLGYSDEHTSLLPFCNKYLKTTLTIGQNHIFFYFSLFQNCLTKKLLNQFVFVFSINRNVDDYLFFKSTQQ